MAHHRSIIEQDKPTYSDESGLGLSDEKFCCELTSVQTLLLCYVMSLVRNRELARDIVQDINLVLWRKRREFNSQFSFRPWALRIAHLQSLAALKSQHRSRLVFDNEVAALLAVEACESDEKIEHRFLRLRECLSKLVGRQKEVVKLHYLKSQSLSQIAEVLGCSSAAIGMLLHRARMSLLACITLGESTP